MPGRKIGEILIESGYLSQAQVKTLLRKQARQREAGTSRLFGELAIEDRLINVRQLDWALQQQKRGNSRRLVRTGLLAIAGAGLLLAAVAHQKGLYPFEPAPLPSAFPLAPDFHAQEINGERRVSLSRFKGNVALVTFWRINERACMEAIPDLVQLQKAFGPAGFYVVSLLIRDGDTSDAFAYDVARNCGITYLLLSGTPQLLARFSPSTELPQSFLVDREGRVIHRYAGDFVLRDVAEDVFQAVKPRD